MTLAAGAASIREIQRLGLVERAREMGEYLGARLRALKDKHISIGDVRGLGLFWCVDLVKNRQTKQPFNTKHDKLDGKPLVVDQVAAAMMKNGVAINSWLSHFVIAPPLIIEPEQIEAGVAALDDALALADEQIGGRDLSRAGL
jgi:taurine--2-oxoglutarate transaminase